MAESAEQVDRIVHEVLSRLGRGAHAAASDAASPSRGELVLLEKVVSAALLAGRLDGVKRVLVSPRAVVTPSARDLLRDRNITLARALKTAPVSAAAAKLIVCTAGVRIDTSSLTNTLRQRGVEIESRAEAEVVQAVNGMAGEIASSRTRGVLLTDEVAAALCLANRRRGVRAATAANRCDVNEVVRSVCANLLIIDGVRRSRFEIQRIVEAFAAAGSVECPPQWKQVLE
jgi:ribosomal protein L12E/L44/L45/RPP1/RPP2